MIILNIKSIFKILLMIVLVFQISTTAQESEEHGSIDSKVEAFLKDHRNDWHDMNIPFQDGKFLHDLIIENNYTRALEIGTSTGHSAIWIARALSKTGGKLITIEINENRYQQAVENFKEAGVSEFIDARLADAHLLVKELDGPFDFVFSDADKSWYRQYFIDVAPKITEGGCYVTHNATARWWNSAEYIDYLKSRDDFKTTVEKDQTSGIAISYKNQSKINPK
ncbi:methyltransferase [candidate division KSB1 bacterium]|nr:methyltransferase [candidate division KSB1 bacterium]